ncbi:PfkB family carbohydrate kinase [Aeromonas allosaccharophila]|uniref:PfkB family carbohydrate kinase n=1 Tax=Aeromonas allosaccharophila TaxID=656 RepID=UPI0034263D34
MNKNDRQRLIKTRLIIDKEVSVKALAGTFSVTERTIRNDLQTLADKHLCEMFYGGARLIKHDEDIYFESTSINNISTLLEAPSTTKARSYPAVSRANETSPEIYILGSFNIDIVLEVNEFPKVGESVLAHSTKYYGGGKGANQAIAAAKINDQVHLTIKVGQDLFADRAKNYLANANIASLNILEDAEHPTGNAIILVSQPSGENKIAINLGANSHITVDDIIHDLDYIRDCRVFLTQLENNFDIMSLAITYAKKSGATTILNPTPYNDSVKKILPFVDIITPNEIEASDLSGIVINDHESARLAAERIYKLGVKHVIITLGDKGCHYFNGNRHFHLVGHKAAVIDSSGAGDSFNGSLAASIANGKSIEDSLIFANAFASLKVERRGASNMPDTSLVEARLSTNNL